MGVVLAVMLVTALIPATSASSWQIATVPTITIEVDPAM
jgi:hypothetical protein